MEDIKKSTAKIWITYGVVGFLLGACLVSVSAVGLVAYESANPPPTQTPNPTPTIAAQAMLDQAYQALYVNRDLQLVLDTLEPHLDEITNPDELVTALEYLGNAELGLGHYRFATVYFERMLQISPTPENYMMLARIYDAGGDLEKAAEYYIIYLNSDAPSLTDDIRIMLEERLDQIQLILTGSTPTLVP